MAWRGKEPKFVTWVVCLVLYIIALLVYFNVLHVDPRIGLWSWIIGFGLLLLAVRFKGL